MAEHPADFGKAKVQFLPRAPARSRSTQHMGRPQARRVVSQTARDRFKSDSLHPHVARCRHRSAARTRARYARNASATLADGSTTPRLAEPRYWTPTPVTQRSTRWRGTKQHMPRPADYRASGSEPGSATFDSLTAEAPSTLRVARFARSSRTPALAGRHFKINASLGWRTTAAPSKRRSPGSIPGRGTTSPWPNG